jgi:hypothetical protein
MTGHAQRPSVNAPGRLSVVDHPEDEQRDDGRLAALVDLPQRAGERQHVVPRQRVDQPGLRAAADDEDREHREDHERHEHLHQPGRQPVARDREQRQRRLLDGLEVGDGEREADQRDHAEHDRAEHRPQHAARHAAARVYRVLGHVRGELEPDKGERAEQAGQGEGVPRRVVEHGGRAGEDARAVLLGLGLAPPTAPAARRTRRFR